MQFLPLLVSAAVGLQLLTCPAAHANSKQAQSIAASTIKTEQAAQKTISAWQQEKQQVIAQIDNKQFELDWLTHQKNKYSKYIATLEANIAEMTRQQEELDNLANAVDPLLEHTVNRLRNFIAQDQPFLSQERHDRLATIEKAIADPHLSQAEQLRRVLEALEIETAYGSDIEMDTEEVTLDGNTIHSDTIRAGRLGYYCISPDKQQVGVWSAEQKQFITLSAEEAQNVLALQKVARRKQIVEVTPLPLTIAVTSETAPDNIPNSTVASKVTAEEAQ